jgi:GT2 family glycosyltransferase
MSAPGKRKVAIIVLTYNGESFVDAWSASLRALEHGEHDVRVYVVDNASKDGSADEAAAKAPFATLIRNAENLGFAGGNNVALRRALAEGADYVYLLNQDAWLAPGAVAEAVRVAEADERIGSVQSMLLLDQDRERINSAGNAIHFLGLGYATGNGTPRAEWRHVGIPEITYASGAAVLYRADALREVGLFDEELFLYHEDLDLGWRLRLAGYGNVLAPHSLAYHHYEFSRSIAKYYYMERNRYVVLLKNLRLWTLVLLAPFLLVSEVALFLASALGGWHREKLRVYRYFLGRRAWRHIEVERAKTVLLRKVSDREIVRLWTPVISFQDVTGPFTKYVANPLMRGVWAVLRLLIV